VDVFNITTAEAVMSEITTFGIDLAKNVLSVHGVDGHGKVVLRKSVTRGKLLELMAQLPACRVGMEACAGAHELARTLTSLGHDARIMAPKFIVPYQESEERRQRCRGDLRSGGSTQHALRPDQERRTTSGAGGASSAS